MSEPVRLLEESDSELERALLRAGQAYRAPEHTRTHTLAALGLVGTSAAVAKTAGAAATLWSVKGWVVAGLVLGGSAVGVATVTAERQAPRADVTPITRSEPAPPLVTKTDLPAPPASVTPEETVMPPTTDDSPPSPPPAPGKRPANRPSLTEELTALDAASAALRGGDGARALKLLDEHARKFPRGRLRLEASVLRIEALAKTGNGAAAGGLAKRFLERHPNSVLAPRVERYAR